MPTEKDLERHINKLIISKIIRTDNNFSESNAETFINQLKNDDPFREHITDNQKCWKGFVSEYVPSYKIKNENNEKTKDFDKDITSLYDEQDTFLSKVFRTTYVHKKSAVSNPVFIDTFILPDLNFICIIGNKKFIEQPELKLKEYMDEMSIKYDEINVCHDFLLWVLWRLSLGKNISDKISLDYFEDLRVGLQNPANFEFDNSPVNIKTEGSGQEIPSLPICYGLFNKKSLNYLKGDFQYNTRSYNVRISISKKNNEEVSILHIHSNGHLEGLHFSEKLQLILPFLYNLSESIYEWDNYDNEKKYPDEEYLDKLLSTAKSEFEETLKSFEEYKKEYLQKID